MTATVTQLPGTVRLPDPGDLSAELRHARRRIAQLETALGEAMRDNLTNFNRAREAERLLADARGYEEMG